MKSKTSETSKEPNQQIAQSQIVAFEQFVKQFKEESDRAAVILAVSKLDSILYQLLSRFLMASSSTKDDLFDGDSAPLSTFSAKILMCHRLGIIRADFFRALNLVRKIRNTFAHEVGDARLEAEANRSRIRDLGLIVSHSEAYNDIKQRFFRDKTEPASTFFTTVTLMIAKLEAIYLKITPLTDDNAYHLVSLKRKDS
jgi:hypothetical protein